jgi:septal ring-binding cell division protein DamX
VARIFDEVRSGHLPRAARSRSRGLLLAALALALAGAGALVTYQAMHRDSSRAGVPAETLPAGTEPILPADIGVTGAGTPAIDGSGGTATTDQSAGAGAQETTTPDLGSAAEQSPAPPLPPATQGNEASRGSLLYEVHVASFTGEDKARGLVKRLRGKGLDAWYAKATNQKNWYRVFVGHFATHEEAARHAASLLDKGMVEHAIAYPDHAR